MHILFDFDGTLADTFHPSLRIINRLAPRLGIRQVPEDEIAHWRGQDHLTVLKAFGVNWWRLPLLAYLLRRQLKREIPNLQSFAGIPQALDELKQAGHTLVILSSNSADNVRAFVRQQGWDHFDQIMGGTSLLGKHKKITHYLRKHNLTGHNALYVGDETRDVEAAQHAGIPVIAVAWGFSLPEALQAAQPDALAATPGVLPKLIAQLAS